MPVAFLPVNLLSFCIKPSGQMISELRIGKDVEGSCHTQGLPKKFIHTLMKENSTLYNRLL